jgi:hypothetical protein
MVTRLSASNFEPVKDLERPHPVPNAWRPAFAAIVASFMRGDFALQDCDPRVATLDPATAEQIDSYLREYGETLAELSDASWSTAECQWFGSHWELYLDLWTRESGCSDMVLDARVYEDGSDVKIAVHLVYVP